MITQEEILELFYYEDGYLYNKTSRTYNSRKDQKVGSLNKMGYLYARVRSKKYRVHRLIFLYHKGYLPDRIDHLDGDITNNNIENLRECTATQNVANQVSCRGSSKFKGVYKYPYGWRAGIGIKGKSIHLGCFLTEKGAAAAYNKAATGLWGEFARLNELGGDSEE